MMVDHDKIERLRNRICGALILTAVVANACASAPPPRQEPTWPQTKCSRACMEAPFYRGSSRMIRFYAEDRANAGRALQLTLAEANAEGGTVVFESGGDYSIAGQKLVVTSGFLRVEEAANLRLHDNLIVFKDR